MPEVPEVKPPCVFPVESYWLVVVEPVVFVNPEAVVFPTPAVEPVVW